MIKKRFDEILQACAGRPNSEQLINQIRHWEKQLEESIFPFDFWGDEAKDHKSRFFIDNLIDWGLLTEEIQPTPFAIENDYFRINDGSKQFDMERQPLLLMTGKGLLFISTLIPDPTNNNNGE